MPERLVSFFFTNHRSASPFQPHPPSFLLPFFLSVFSKEFWRNYLPKAPPIFKIRSTNTMTHSAEVVGQSFVRNYYTALNADPGSVHLFYEYDAVYSQGWEGEAVTAPIVGKEAIRSHFAENGAGEVSVLSVVVAQPSVDDAVLVVVSGMWRARGSEQAAQRFVETFYLVCRGPQQFVLRNDILQVLADQVPEPTTVKSATQPQVCETPVNKEVTAEATAAAEATDVAPAPAVEADAAPAPAVEQSSAPSVQPELQQESAQPSKQQQQTKPAKSVATTQVAAAPATTAAAAAQQAPARAAAAKSSSAPRSWANIAAAPTPAPAPSAAPVAQTAASAAPAPAPAPGGASSTSKTVSGKQTTAAGAPSTKKTAAGLAAGAGAVSPAVGNKKDQSTLWVGSFPNGVDEERLHRELSRLQPVVKIVVPSQKNYAFVQFKNVDAAQKVLANLEEAPLTFDGHKVSAKFKNFKKPASAGGSGSNSSNNANNKGGYPNRSRGGRGGSGRGMGRGGSAGRGDASGGRGGTGGRRGGGASSRD